MRHTTLKLVAVLCVTLLLSFTAILVVFHLTMNHYIESNAVKAIRYAATEFNSIAEYNDSEYNEDYELFTMASWLLVDRNYEPSYNINRMRDLAQWCKDNLDTGGAIAEAWVNGRSYYVAQGLGNPEFDEDGEIWLIYVDVTGERALVKRVDISMLVIMSLCGFMACCIGIRIGVSIERRQKRQKKFFENASHELKTPLMSIQGYAEGIYDGIITDQKHAVCVIMNETDKITALVDEILCLSRIESGETELCIEDVSVEAVMNNCLVSLESVVIKKGIEVKTDIAGGTVQADAAQMETAVMNLLANAVKYADHRIAICYDKKRLIIWNDGSGITDEDAPHVFERFYIGKNGNTGIGLALTKEIIERHGWRICADTADGGTRFIVRFSRF